MPWGNTNSPLPKLRSSVPDGSKARIGSSVRPVHVVLAHLSATHTVPRASTWTALVLPYGLPVGSCPQLWPLWYGLGWEFGAGVVCVATGAAIRATPAKKPRTNFILGAGPFEVVSRAGNLSNLPL